MLKIYGPARSRAFRVIWLCKETGIPFEHIPLTINGDNPQCKEPWYLTLNPNGRVPTIDDDGLVMWESAVRSCRVSEVSSLASRQRRTSDGEGSAPAAGIGRPSAVGVSLHPQSSETCQRPRRADSPCEPRL